MLFKKRSYEQAMAKYDEIITLDKFNIDAINSKAYCVKFIAAAKGN